MRVILDDEQHRIARFYRVSIVLNVLFPGSRKDSERAGARTSARSDSEWHGPRVVGPRIVERQEQGERAALCRAR